MPGQYAHVVIVDEELDILFAAIISARFENGFHSSEAILALMHLLLLLQSSSI